MTQKTNQAQSSDTHKEKNGKISSETKSSRMPKNSVLFEKIVPAALVFLGLIMLGLIGIAIAVLVGLVSY